MSCDAYLALHTKLNSNVSKKNDKISRRKHGRYLYVLGISKDFLGHKKTLSIKEEND